MSRPKRRVVATGIVGLGCPRIQVASDGDIGTR